jgi:hypothetical protein
MQCGPPHCNCSTSTTLDFQRFVVFDYPSYGSGLCFHLLLIPPQKSYYKTFIPILTRLDNCPYGVYSLNISYNVAHLAFCCTYIAGDNNSGYVLGFTKVDKIPLPLLLEMG